MSMLLPVVVVLAGANDKQKTQIYIPSQISSYKTGLLLKRCNVILKEHMGGRLSRHSRRPKQSTRRPLGHTLPYRPFLSFPFYFNSLISADCLSMSDPSDHRYIAVHSTQMLEEHVIDGKARNRGHLRKFKEWSTIF